MTQSICKFAEPLLHSGKLGVIHREIKPVDHDEAAGIFAKVQHAMNRIHPAREKCYGTTLCRRFFFTGKDGNAVKQGIPAAPYFLDLLNIGKQTSGYRRHMGQVERAALIHRGKQADGEIGICAFGQIAEGSAVEMYVESVYGAGNSRNSFYAIA